MARTLDYAHPPDRAAPLTTAPQWYPLARGSFAAWLGSLMLTMFVLATAEASPVIRRLPLAVLLPIMTAVLVAFPLGCAATGAFAIWRISSSRGGLKGWLPATFALVLGVIHAVFGFMMLFVPSALN
jgi:hypothetical protein